MHILVLKYKTIQSDSIDIDSIIQITILRHGQYLCAISAARL